MDWRSQDEQQTFEVLMAAAKEFSDRSSIEVGPRTKDRGVILELIPGAQGTAPLQAHIENAQNVVITIGRALALDVHQGGNNREQYLAFLADVVRAVAHGRVEETVWLVGDHVKRAQGTLELENGERHRISYRSLWPPRKGKSVTIRYCPY